MSDRLAISSAFSILMMAGYVLMGGHAMQVRLETQALLVPHISAPTILPQVSALLSR